MSNASGVCWEGSGDACVNEVNLVYQESSDVFVEGEMKMHMYSEMNFSECSENAFSGVSLCSEQFDK